MPRLFGPAGLDIPTINNRASLKVPTSSSPSSPSDIPDLALWLKADAGTSTTVDGAAISQWDDQSGNGRHATQGTAEFRPTYQTNEVNGQPVVRFDTSDDTMAATVPAGAAKTVIVVARRTSLAGGSHSPWGLGAANAQIFDNAGAWAYYPNEANAVVALGGSTATFSVVTVVYASTSSATAYINGGGGTAFDPNDGYATQTALGVGCATPAEANLWDGDIAELIVFGTALAPADLDAMETYLAAKYAITLA